MNLSLAIISYNKFEKMDGQLIYTIVYGRSLGSFVFFEIFGDKSKDNSNINFDSVLHIYWMIKTT